MKTGAHSGRTYGKVQPVYASEAALSSIQTPRLPDRPARVQVEQKRALQQAEHAGDFNIWYGRYMGENNFERAPKAATRVCIETDAGLTRADYTSATAHVCLHFARGDCIYGKDCTFRHAAPTEEDESMADAPHDVFGRNRHASWRDDMGGTGTWNKECKTLYVGRLCNLPSEQVMTEIVVRHFGEFGPIESVRVLKSKGCAFVTYKLRCTAEFAKEAMAEQSLDHDEQINMRWAYDDPNPRAQAMRLRNNAQIMLAAMEAKGHLPQQEEASFYADADDVSEEPDAKRLRSADGSGSSDIGPTPLTREEHAQQLAEAEAQLEAAAAAEAAAASAVAEEARRVQAASEASRLDAILNQIDNDGPVGGVAAAPDPLADFLRSVDGHGAVAAASTAPHARDADVSLPPGVWQPRRLPAGWREYADPASGHPYFVGPDGQTTWKHPTG